MKHSNYKEKNFKIEKSPTINYKVLASFILIIIFLFTVIVARLFYWQFIYADNLKKAAYNQQSLNQIISPKRGNIYDRNGNALAISSVCDTITVNPQLIIVSNDDENIAKEKTKELKEKVATGLSQIFELDYSETLEKLNSTASVVTIAKKVEQDKVDELKAWMEENSVYSGINIEEDTKRTYPYSTLVSHVLGFCGTDNQGLSGLESAYESTLKGTEGKIISYKSPSYEEIPDTEVFYEPAEDGNDLTLTLDVHIQTIAKKYLKEAVEENGCERGGNVIIMDPSNGDVLAMATYPDYDCNDPFTPNETVAQTYYSLSDEEKSNALLEMWRNKSCNELYEPGSVFKIITASIALEENITSTDVAGDFNCTGSETFSDGTIIDCWSTSAHGLLDLRHALMYSCNPSFMQLGSRIGKETLYKYYQAFGLMDITNIGLSEENSLFTSYDDVREVEVATMSFGQRLNITPLQMISALCAVANDGVLVQPRIVKSVTNSSTGYVEVNSVNEVRQVISKETAQSVKSMMLSVVEEGTGKFCQIEGYKIGGKSGTSEPLDNKKEDGYTASFTAMAPYDNPEVVILVTLYKPTGLLHHGGEIAAPVVKNILTEILPYLGVEMEE